MDESAEKKILVAYSIVVLVWGLSMFTPNLHLKESTGDTVAYGVFTGYAILSLIFNIVTPFSRSHMFHAINGTIAFLGIAYVIRGFYMDDYAPLIEGLILVILSFAALVMVIKGMNGEGYYWHMWIAFLVLAVIIGLVLLVPIVEAAGHLGDSYKDNAEFFAALCLFLVDVFSLFLAAIFLKPGDFDL